MLKIHALNRDSSSDEDPPGIRREAQVIKQIFQNTKKIHIINFVIIGGNCT